jgi:hypothetical protein
MDVAICDAISDCACVLATGDLELAERTAAHVLTRALSASPSPLDDAAEVERLARLIREETMVADGYSREQARRDEDALWFHFKPAAIAVLATLREEVSP